LGKQASGVPIAEGKFVSPSTWLARFDIGKCGPHDIAEADLSILAKASLERDNTIFSNVTLETMQGQAANFSIRSKLGENFLIIGVPNTLFGAEPNPQAETIVFMVPRIIRTAKTTRNLKNNL
jgi:hypothetical protein